MSNYCHHSQKRRTQSNESISVCIRIACRICLFAVLTFLGTNASAQSITDCDLTVAAMNDIRDVLLDFDGPDGIAGSWDAFIDVLNGQGNNNWTTVGPRSLALDSSERGTVLGGMPRTFLMPPTDKGTIRVELDKVGGRAETDITICSHGRNDRAAAGSHTFPNTRDVISHSFVIADATDKVISIVIRNRSVANKFEYIISASAPEASTKKRRRLLPGR